MSLSKVFFDYLLTLGEEEFTLQEATKWLVEQRFGKPVYQTQVFDLLINPLIQIGVIRRAGRGVYSLMSPQVDSNVGSGDEFDSYLKEKGVKK